MSVRTEVFAENFTRRKLPRLIQDSVNSVLSVSTRGNIKNAAQGRIELENRAGYSLLHLLPQLPMSLVLSMLHANDMNCLRIASSKMFKDRWLRKAIEYCSEQRLRCWCPGYCADKSLSKDDQCENTQQIKNINRTHTSEVEIVRRAIIRRGILRSQMVTSGFGKTEYTNWLETIQLEPYLHEIKKDLNPVIKIINKNKSHCLPWTTLLRAHELVLSLVNTNEEEGTILSHDGEPLGSSPLLIGAALLGHPFAQFHLAVALIRDDESLTIRSTRKINKPGYGFEHCLFWLANSADVLATSQFCLATAITFPEAQSVKPALQKNVPPICSWVHRLYSQAASDGNASAMVNCGMICWGSFPFPECSIGFEKYKAIHAPELAIRWWKIAAELDQLEAILNLGHLFTEGVPGLPGMEPNPKEALKHWKQAAKLGDGRGHLMVASAYELGEGCQPNLEKALKHYSAAAVMDNIEIREAACSNLERLRLELDDAD